MSIKKELAMKVMEYANEFTHWNFQMEQEGENYRIETTLMDLNGRVLGIYYLIDEELAELEVAAINGKFDYDFLQKKINEIAQRYPVYAMGKGTVEESTSISIIAPMPLAILDKDMSVIIRERMVDMLQAMTDIINFK